MDDRTLRTAIAAADGDDPYRALRALRKARVDVEPVTGIRDLTGAGDAFAAGFLAATLRGADPATACLEGHALAASVLTNPGAHVAPVAPPPPRSST